MKLPSFTPVARSLAALRRWWWSGWFGRLPAVARYRAARARAGRDRPKLRFYGQSPWLEVIEERSMPNDVLGMGAAPLGLTELSVLGSQHTPGYVLLHGWSGPPHGKPVTSTAWPAAPTNQPSAVPHPLGVVTWLSGRGVPLGSSVYLTLATGNPAGCTGFPGSTPWKAETSARKRRWSSQVSSTKSPASRRSSKPNER